MLDHELDLAKLACPDCGAVKYGYVTGFAGLECGECHERIMWSAARDLPTCQPGPAEHLFLARALVARQASLLNAPLAGRDWARALVLVDDALAAVLHAKESYQLFRLTEKERR